MTTQDKAAVIYRCGLIVGRLSNLTSDDIREAIKDAAFLHPEYANHLRAVALLCDELRKPAAGGDA